MPAPAAASARRSDRRPRLLQHGNRGCRRQDRRLAGAGDDWRGAARLGRSRHVSRCEPGDARRHRRHGPAHAPVQDGGDGEEPQPRGPVHLSLTHDALVGESAADYVAVAGFFAHAWRLSTEAAETALRLLADKAGAKSRIAILAGAGVEHDAAAARLKEIAERWSIPVATTLRAKG